MSHLSATRKWGNMGEVCMRGTKKASLKSELTGKYGEYTLRVSKEQFNSTSAPTPASSSIIVIVEGELLQHLDGQNCFSLNVTCFPRDALDENPWKLIAFTECSLADMIPHKDQRIVNSPSWKTFQALIFRLAHSRPARNVLLSLPDFLNLSRFYIFIPSHFLRRLWMKDVYVIQH